MRTLVVADRFPWPVTGGGFMRLATIVEALSELGEVELFVLSNKNRPEQIVPPGMAVSRLGSAPFPALAPWWRWRPEWLVRPGIPIEVTERRFDKSPQRAFESWVSGPYDLVWFIPAMVYEWLGRPMLGPTVVDLDNLGSEMEKQRVHLMRESSADPGLKGFGHRWIAMTQARLNARDWRGFEHSVARSVERVVLCSELDVQRSGLGNAEVIPNSYERPTRELGRSEVAARPVILFQGSLEYGPNAEAATWLAHQLAALIRTRVPGAEVRLVGTTTPRIERLLHDPPRVTVVGRVPAMERELARADLVAVPLRSGSGTRVKILESFAHRIPVVSTAIGAEGLGVDPGVHLLVADDPDSFASACQRLLTDVNLRERIVDAAELLYLERYEWSSVKERIQALAREVGVTGQRT